MEKSNIGEKIKLLTGSGMWHTREAEGLPSVHLSDGPHGLRKRRKRSVRTMSVWCPPATPRPVPWPVLGT